MTIDEYISNVKERLLSDDTVVRFHIVRERTTSSDGHLRVRAFLVSENHLDFSEYIRRLPDGRIVIVTYSYHWSNENRILVCRWDNAFHHPTVPNFPHHIHCGGENIIQPGEPIDVFTILDIIRAAINLKL